MFDDRDYVQQRQEEEAIELAVDKDAEIAKQAQDRLDYIKSVIDTMQGAKTPHELKKIHDTAVRQLTLRKDEKGAARISLEWKKLSEPKQETAA